MPVQAINNAQSKNFNRINYVKVTGYSALALGTASIVQASRHKIKSHKLLACLSVLSALTHVGILKYYKYKK